MLHTASVAISSSERKRWETEFDVASLIFNGTPTSGHTLGMARLLFHSMIIYNETRTQVKFLRFRYSQN